MKIRLRAIIFNRDFRKNEASLFDEFRESQEYRGDLRKNEAYLFVSGSGNQLLWILNNADIETCGGDAVELIDTRKMRLRGRTGWNPAMLQSYAQDAGIELVGMRHFTEAYNKHRLEVQEQQRMARQARRDIEAEVSRTYVAARRARPERMAAVAAHH